MGEASAVRSCTSTAPGAGPVNVGWTHCGSGPGCHPQSPATSGGAFRLVPQFRLLSSSCQLQVLSAAHRLPAFLAATAGLGGRLPPADRSISSEHAGAIAGTLHLRPSLSWGGAFTFAGVPACLACLRGRLPLWQSPWLSLVQPSLESPPKVLSPSSLPTPALDKRTMTCASKCTNGRESAILPLRSGPGLAMQIAGLWGVLRGLCNRKSPMQSPNKPQKPQKAPTHKNLPLDLH